MFVASQVTLGEANVLERQVGAQEMARAGGHDGPTTAGRTDAPLVVILSPANDSIITNGASAVLSFEVSGFNLTAPAGQGDVPGEGHANILVDGTLLTTVSTTAPVDIPYADGPRTVTVELVNNDGSALDPIVEAFVNIEMTHGPDTGSPSIVIWSPSDGSSVNGPDVLLSFTVYNFAIVVPDGQPDAPNEGHIHLFLDGLFIAMITQEVQVILPSVSQGTHDVRLLMVNNDHSPYLVNGSQQVSVSVSFTVSAPSSPLQGQVDLLEDISFWILGVALLTLVVAVMVRPRSPSPVRSPPAATEVPASMKKAESTNDFD